MSKGDASAPRIFTFSFVCATVVNFVLMVNYFMLMVTMTEYAMDEFASPESLAGFCSSIFIIGTLVARFASGPLVDRIGRKLCLVVGTAAVVAFSAAYFVPLPLPALFALRFVHGFAYGVSSTACGTIVTSIVPPEKKGEGVGYYMLSVTLGAALGPSVGIAIYQNFDYSILFGCATFAAALACVSAISLRVPKYTPEPGIEAALADDELAVELAEDAKLGVEGVNLRATFAYPPAAVGSNAAAAESVDQPLYPEGRVVREGLGVPEGSALDTRIGTDSRTSPAPSPSPSPFIKVVSTVIELPVLALSLVCGVLYFGYSSLLTFLTPYATAMDLGAAASVYFIVYAITMFVTRPATGKAYDRRGPLGVMVSAFLSFVVGMAVLAFAQNAVVLLLSAVFLGYGVGTVQSCGLTLAVEHTPETRLSLANSTFYICLDVGVGLGPLVLGFVVPVVGYSAMYLMLAGLVLLDTFAFVWVLRRTG